MANDPGADLLYGPGDSNGLRSLGDESELRAPVARPGGELRPGPLTDAVGEAFGRSLVRNLAA